MESDSVKTSQFKSAYLDFKNILLDFEYWTAMVSRNFISSCSCISFSKCGICISAFCVSCIFFLRKSKVKNFDLSKYYLWKQQFDVFESTSLSFLNYIFTVEIDNTYPTSHPIVFWFFSDTSNVNEPFLEVVNMRC